jgi:hypothetical protein
MNSSFFIFVLPLLGVSVAIAFGNRRILLAKKQTLSIRDLRVGFACIALLAGSSLPLLFLLSYPTALQSTLLAFLPIFFLASYLFEIAIAWRLRPRFKNSPLFWLAILSPFVGCAWLLLVFLEVSREERE